MDKEYELSDQENLVLKKNNVSFHLFAQIEDSGSKKTLERFKFIPSKKDDIITIVYTSGSTGFFYFLFFIFYFLFFIFYFYFLFFIFYFYFLFFILFLFYYFIFH